MTMSFGNAMSLTLLFLALPLIGALFYLLAVIRIFRASPLGAIVMFFLAPLAGLFMMIRYWGDPEYDIRWRMFASLGCNAIFVAVFVWSAFYSIDERRAAEQGYGTRPHSELEQRVQYVAAVSDITLRIGRNDIPDAHASIDVPQHFRFVDKGDLETLYAASGQSVPAYVVGWLVHESVNLANDDAWYIQIKWRGEGFFAESDAQQMSPMALALQAKVTSEKLSALLRVEPDAIDQVQFVGAPEFDPRRHSATWTFESGNTDDADAPLACHAARLGRRGAFLFEVADMSKLRQELCLRAVRLASARIAFGPGEDYAEHSIFDHGAGTDLAGLIAGTLVWTL
jgi:Protein of unknown function (DUF2167)